MRREMYVILDGTPVCDKFCRICATSAVHIDPGLYSSVHSDLVELGYDLPLEQKKQIIKRLAEASGIDIRIEIGNGNLLVSNEGLQLIKEASKAFGPENVLISISGSLITEEKAKVIGENVSKVIVSIDVPTGMLDETRYPHITEDATNCIDIFSQKDIPVCVCTVLKRNNTHTHVLQKILEHILKHGATEWELLRFYPVGRALHMNQYEPSLSQYFEMLSFVKHAREMQDKISIRLHHSLAYIFEGKTEYCQAVTDQIAVRSNGIVVACPWSHDQVGNPLSPLFVLGKLPEMSIEEVLDTPVTEFWREIKEKGPCRLAAFLQYTKQGVHHEIALQKPDPLDIKRKTVSPNNDFKELYRIFLDGDTEDHICRKPDVEAMSQK